MTASIVSIGRDLDPGFYIVRLQEDEPPEVARNVEGAWYLTGNDMALVAGDFVEIGARLDIDPITLACRPVPGGGPRRP